MRVFSSVGASDFLVSESVLVLAEDEEGGRNICAAVRRCGHSASSVTPATIRSGGLDDAMSGCSSLIVVARSAGRGRVGRGQGVQRRLVGAAVEVLTQSDTRRVLVVVLDDVGDGISATRRARRLSRDIAYEASMNGIWVASDTEFLAASFSSASFSSASFSSASFSTAAGRASGLDSTALSAIEGWCHGGRVPDAGAATRRTAVVGYR